MYFAQKTNIDTIFFSVNFYLKVNYTYILEEADHFLLIAFLAYDKSELIVKLHKLCVWVEFVHFFGLWYPEAYDVI